MIELVTELDAKTFECLAAKARLLQRAEEAANWKAAALQCESRRKEDAARVLELQEKNEQLSGRLQQLLLLHRREEETSHDLRVELRQKDDEARRYLQRNDELLRQLAVASWEVQRLSGDAHCVSKERPGPFGGSLFGVAAASHQKKTLDTDGAFAPKPAGGEEETDVGLLSYMEVLEHNK
ncbi:hypothetical protein TGRUB_432240 [Toxoplasma gondii RUB]|uniref:Uncharacterized protein n=1 Tax=Toxoplasma gondii RUB TaxID=935652 RepID=A0A086LTH4_TOXGO|nr:hypothetical protein TGRUB_432240 [Toxoplasma gondii RUB]